MARQPSKPEANEPTVLAETQSQSETVMQSPAPPSEAPPAEPKPTIHPTSKGPAQMSLAELLGDCVRRVVTNRAAVTGARSDLEVWYYAQDQSTPEARRLWAQQTRKDIETGKQAMEALFEHFCLIARNEF